MTTTDSTPAQELDVTRVPWSENMIEVNAGARVDEVLEAANLNWEVEFSPLYRRVDTISVTSVNEANGQTITVDDVPTDPRWEVAPEIRDVVKRPERKVLGQVRGDYVLTQNAEAFRFADNLVDDGLGRWVAAGSQYDDKVVFGVMQLMDAGITIDGIDPIDLYLMLRTSHNGGTGIQAIVTPIRPRCANMLTLATKQAKFRWSLRHVSTLEGRLQEARDTLRLATAYMHDGLQVELEKLLEVPVSEEVARWTLERIIPASRSRRDAVIDGILVATESQEYNGYQGTGYGLLNGLTDYYDHNIKRRTATSRLQEQVDGEGAQMRNKLVAELLSR
jgi:phage/plasmid-like protein (TIGR03299 family)